MTRPSFLIDVRLHSTELERDVRSGGLFVQGVQQPLNQHCEVTFRFDDAEQSIDARVVFADVKGIGLELFVMPPERLALAERIRSALASGADDSPLGDRLPQVPHDERPGADDGEGDSADDQLVAERDIEDSEAAQGNARRYAPLHERVRNLSVPEQLRLAQRGEQQERMLLERLYGKTVWEALLRNPRITSPEVARIARMGALPKPLLEIIVGNQTWLQVPEVRRALLGNLRLAAEMIPRVLRLLPRHELKLVPAQLAYSSAVRDVARRMLRE
jgi:hypothetical protein